MLNGKFFTGLPPKMIDRRGSGNRNRLESHLFWPDDTEVDTAIESRIKRRNSVQLANTEIPQYGTQTSVADNDVDTKKRFSKEFSQSSIQFYDNLNENRSNPRKPLLRNSVGKKKMEITEKPTATKLELPESVIDEAYTAAKKKQAYTSKIEFYDYVNEGGEQQINRNNLRKPKMDMNDKREMELNRKNSPKLQVKRSVRSLSEEKDQRKMNNSEVVATESAATAKTNNSYDQRERERILNNDERYLQNRKSHEPRKNISPKRGLAKTTNSYEQRYSSEREIHREPETTVRDKRTPTYFDSSKEIRDYARDTATPELHENRRFSQKDYEKIEGNSQYIRDNDEPKRTIRNNSRQYYGLPENRNDFYEYQAEEEIRSRIRDIHLKSPPPQRQYYPPEVYYDDEPQQQYYHRSDQINTPTNRGSSLEQFEYNDKEFNEVDLPYENNKTFRQINRNNSPINKINNPIQQKAIAKSTSPLHNDTESLSAKKLQRNLRSSLGFNDGEIVGKNDATRLPTSTSAAERYQTQKRSARNSATQRVSVGLPD